MSPPLRRLGRIRLPSIAGLARYRHIGAMTVIDAEMLQRLPRAKIEEVRFYKRDEITTDLICCEVMAEGAAWTFHEKLVGWDLLLRHLEKLPGFRSDWFAAVSQPPFAASETVAFHRR